MKPFACPPMMVMSPSLGVGLLIGIYCLIVKRHSGSEGEVVTTKSRMCEAEITCSFIWKGKGEARIIVNKAIFHPVVPKFSPLEKDAENI